MGVVRAKVMLRSNRCNRRCKKDQIILKFAVIGAKFSQVDTNRDSLTLTPSSCATTSMSQMNDAAMSWSDPCVPVDTPYPDPEEHSTV